MSDIIDLTVILDFGMVMCSFLSKKKVIASEVPLQSFVFSYKINNFHLPLYKSKYLNIVVTLVAFVFLRSETSMLLRLSKYEE